MYPWQASGWRELVDLFADDMHDGCAVLHCCLPVLTRPASSARLVAPIAFIDGWRPCKTRPHNIKNVAVAFANDKVRLRSHPFAPASNAAILY